jgi:negative regulator of replication initiation
MTNADDLVFARGDEHDQRVQVLLTADEYIFARDHAKEIGLSASGYLRKLLNDDRRFVAQKQLSTSNALLDTPEVTQDMHKLLKALASLIRES